MPGALDSDYLTRFASRLACWEHEGRDMKALFPREAAAERARKPKMPKGKKVRITNKQAAQLAE